VLGEGYPQMPDTRSGSALPLGASGNLCAPARSVETCEGDEGAHLRDAFGVTAHLSASTVENACEDCPLHDQNVTSQAACLRHQALGPTRLRSRQR
jgi:hypothetical protein